MTLSFLFLRDLRVLRGKKSAFFLSLCSQCPLGYLTVNQQV